MSFVSQVSHPNGGWKLQVDTTGCSRFAWLPLSPKKDEAKSKPTSFLNSNCWVHDNDPNGLLGLHSPKQLPENNMDVLVILAHTCNIFLYLVKCLFWSFSQVQKSLQISAKSNSPTMIQVSKSRHGCTALMNWGTHRCRARRVYCEARSPQRQGVRHSTRQAGVCITSGHFHTYHFTFFPFNASQLISSAPRPMLVNGPKAGISGSMPPRVAQPT